MSSPSNKRGLRHDIRDGSDVDQLIDYFYRQKVLPDAIIGFLFTDIAQIDLDQHLPKVAGFWKKVLLGQNTYQGRMFEAHHQLNRKVPLNRHHFRRWLYLFEQSVDELFIGEQAERAKKRANSIAEAMLSGLKNPY